MFPSGVPFETTSVPPDTPAPDTVNAPDTVRPAFAFTKLVNVAPDALSVPLDVIV